MLIQVSDLGETAFRKLMEIYVEGNRENAAYFYPEVPPEEGLVRAEQDFELFLRREFLTQPENTLYVWQVEEQWVAALRLTELDGFFYLEALETRPDQRRRGYGTALLRELCRTLAAAGPVTIRDCVRKTNEASLRTHLAAGFVVDQDPGQEYPGGQMDGRCYGMLYRSGDGQEEQPMESR